MSDPKVAQQIGTEINNAGKIELGVVLDNTVTPEMTRTAMNDYLSNPDAEVEALGEAGNIVEQQPVVPESPKFLDATKGEKKFWRIIFLSEFDVSGDIATATTKADDALTLHKARFG